MYMIPPRVVWPGQLSSDAYASFLRAAELGCTLREPWLVANAVTYLCNYSSHLLQTDKLSVLVPVFRPLLASVVAVREHDNDSHIVLVSRIFPMCGRSFLLICIVGMMWCVV